MMMLLMIFHLDGAPLKTLFLSFQFLLPSFLSFSFFGSRLLSAVCVVVRCCRRIGCRCKPEPDDDDGLVVSFCSSPHIIPPHPPRRRRYSKSGSWTRFPTAFFLVCLVGEAALPSESDAHQLIFSLSLTLTQHRVESATDFGALAFVSVRKE